MSDKALSAREKGELYQKATTVLKEKTLTPAGGGAATDTVKKGINQAPYVTTGPVGRDSDGFNLLKAIGAQRGFIDRDLAKPELDACERFEKALRETRCDPNNREPGSIMIPFAMHHLPGEAAKHEGAVYMKAMWNAGMQGFDPDEALWLARRMVKADPTLQKAAMSYLTDNIGGTLVAPSAQGELIELVRPRECLMAAGATSVPIPANGKIGWPRQTGATSFYWVGENTAVTESNPTTGQVVMQARKGGVLTRVPNELFRFANVAADGLIRTDMAKSIALGIDYAGLYGSGSASQPKGLTLYTGTNEVIDYAASTPAPGGIGANGNALRPEDGYYMAGLIEDRNFEHKGWIMRPTLANNISGFRADAAAPGDKAGQFVQSMMRAISDKLPGDNWCGYKITKSAVVKANQGKGSATNLTDVFGGQWDHLLVGTYGAIEIASSIHGDSTFPQDQTLIRSLVFTDIVPRYEGAFVWYKQVTQR
ncbi:MAG: phage major capsid protein [Rhizobium sp.]|nr:MAG: phage major capsid protein [Rhizobium sp.]